MKEKIVFTDVETSEKIEFYVIEETKINNMNYLLVSEQDPDVEPEDGDEEDVAYILKDLSSGNDTEARYEIVEDETELEYLSKIFGELLDDVEIDL